MQGFPLNLVQHENWTHRQMMELAGNAFNAMTLSAVILAYLKDCPWDTPAGEDDNSEDWDEDIESEFLDGEACESESISASGDEDINKSLFLESDSD